MSWQLRLGACIGFCIAYPVAAWTKSGNGLEPHVSATVAVCIRADIQEKTLATARDIAAQIFRTAGIDLRWVDSGNCSTLPSGKYFLVVIDAVPPRGWTSADAMGLALVGSANRRAYVFLDRVLNFIELNQTQTHYTSADAIVLGHVMAHEIGHLMLADGMHSHRGIMRSRWRSLDWKQAAAGRLLFLPDQVQLLKTRLDSTLN